MAQMVIHPASANPATKSSGVATPTMQLAALVRWLGSTHPAYALWVAMTGSQAVPVVITACRCHQLGSFRMSGVQRFNLTWASEVVEHALRQP